MTKNRQFNIAVLACLIINDCANKAPAPKPYDTSLPTDGSLIY
jgi:hypothetical protein